jgi:hypothetical protein
MSNLQLLAPENQQPAFVATPHIAEVLSGGSSLGNSEFQIFVLTAPKSISRGHYLSRALRGDVSGSFLRADYSATELLVFNGEWVVLHGGEVVSHGPDPVRVVAEARGRGILAPYIFRVQRRENDTFTFGL